MLMSTHQSGWWVSLNLTIDTVIWSFLILGILTNPFILTAKEKYFAAGDAARSLQKRFAREAKIDIVARVQDTLQKLTGIPVRIAREGSKEYFAGLLRLINSSALIHADYGPYVRVSLPVSQASLVMLSCPLLRNHWSL